MWLPSEQDIPRIALLVTARTTWHFKIFHLRRILGLLSILLDYAMRSTLKHQHLGGRAFSTTSLLRKSLSLLNTALVCWAAGLL